MRILILTPRLPWPPIDGGRVAMARLAQALGRCGAEVDILSLNPRKHRADVGAAAMPVRAIDIDTSRVVAPALRSMTSDVPYVIARFVSGKFRDAIETIVRERKPDVVQIEGPFMLPYVETVRAASGAHARFFNGHARVALRSLNVEFRIWEGLALSARNPLRRLALRRVAASMRAYEVKHLDTTDAMVPISAADAADFRSLGCTKPMHVVPCGVDLPVITSELEPGTVGFIGSLDFRPNQQAVVWILDELWPRVAQRAPEARLAIAGSSPPVWLEEHARARGIAIQRDVEDAEAFVRRMSVIIAPLFAGGGMRIKVLDAMALAKPIVATPIGAGGIDVHHGHDILIAEDAPSFADAVVQLLRDPASAKRLGNAARAMVAERYDSDRLARELLGFYRTLFVDGGPLPRA